MIKFLVSHIQAKLMLVFIVLLVIPAFLVSNTEANFSAALVVSGAQANEVSTVRQQVQQIQNQLAQAKDDVTYLSLMPETMMTAMAMLSIPTSTRNTYETAIANFLSQHPSYLDIAILDTQGHAVSRVNNIAGRPQIVSADKLGNTSLPYLADVLKLQAGQVYSSTFDTTSSVPMLHYAVPLFSMPGMAVGVLTLTASEQAITTFLLPATDEDVYLLDASGKSILNTDSTMTPVNFADDQPHNWAAILSEPEGTLLQSSDHPDSLEVFERFTIPSANAPMYVVVDDKPMAGLLSDTNNLRTQRFVIFGGIALILGIILWFATRRIVQPLHQLAVAVGSIHESISTGTFDVTVPGIKRADEIGELSRTFVAMTGELQSLYKDLEQHVKARTSELATVARVSSAATQLLRVEPLIDEVIYQIRKSFDFEHVEIFLVNEANAKPALLTFNTLVSASKKKALDDPLAEESAQKQRIVTYSVEGVITRIALPLIFGGNFLGVLEVRGLEISSSAQRVLATLADQIAVALQNAKQYENQVQIAQSLRELDEMKNSFLANMSHELRTPLNSILNNTYFVLEGIYGDVNEEQIDALNMVHRSGKDLLALINDLLDFTKIESGMMELFIQDDVNLDELLHEVYETGKSLVQDKGTNLIFLPTPDLPSIVSVDRQRLKQILLNLVSNAVKFTPADGTITLGAYYRDGSVTFYVRDTGIGIAEQDRELIFQPFRQTKEGLKKAASTGLGLPISRALAEKHGGQLGLESVVGEGSTFFVRVPVQIEISVAVY